MPDTPQQTAVYNFVRNETGHGAVVARAGCGKTYTIVKSIDVIADAFPRAETLVVAFNKSIAVEMKEKLIKAGHDNWRKVQASTLHALGMGLVNYVFNRPQLDDNKVYNLVKMLNDPFADHYTAAIVKLVKTAKSEGFGFFGDRQIGDMGAWYNMADHYDVNGFDDTSDLDQCVQYAQQVYRMSLDQTDVIDFDDMILFPLVKNLRVGFPKDFVFVDEAQDLSRARQALVRKFVKPNGGRMIIVGDDRQAIYGFSGADSDALTNMIRALKAHVMPLSVTWRCPVAVVTKAQEFVPDIEFAPGAKEGYVGSISELPDDLGPGTAILCRNTAPLIETVYSLIRKRIPAKVEGRDIGRGLLTLIKRWKTQDLDVYLDKLNDYQEREVQKALAKNNEAKAQQVEDKCETIRCIAKQCMVEGNPTIDAMVAAVDELFGDNVTDCVVLATYHKSKGREWPRVILVAHNEYCPSKWAKQDWQKHQEDNLAYVAFTRSENELLFWV